MRRLTYLYSPAVVLASWAILFWALGRTDGLVVVGCCVLAVAMVLHTYETVKDHYRRNGRRRKIS